MKVRDIFKGNLDQILSLTGYNTRDDKNEIIDYYGYGFKNCNALQSLTKKRIPKDSFFTSLFHLRIRLNQISL